MSTHTHRRGLKHTLLVTWAFFLFAVKKIKFNIEPADYRFYSGRRSVNSTITVLVFELQEESEQTHTACRHLALGWVSHGWRRNERRFLLKTTLVAKNHLAKVHYEKSRLKYRGKKIHVSKPGTTGKNPRWLYTGQTVSGH